MQTENNKLFFISGVFSFSFFALILFLVGWQVILSSHPTSFAMVQSDVISVSLEISDNHAAEPIVEEETPSASEPVTPPKAEQQEIKHEVAPVQPEITDLFSTIKTSTPVPQKKESQHQTKLNELEKKILATKRDSQLLEKAKSVNLAKSGVKMVASSSGPLVNEYYAKVQGIIYANFHPASGTEGFSARVRITLSANGTLEGYRVISYSGNSVFNAEVDLLKERLGQVPLPSHPEGQNVTFEIILTAKD